MQEEGVTRLVVAVGSHDIKQRLTNCLYIMTKGFSACYPNTNHAKLY
jgi:hypothetical protein